MGAPGGLGLARSPPSHAACLDSALSVESQALPSTAGQPFRLHGRPSGTGLRLRKRLLLSPASGQASTGSVGSEEGSSGGGSQEGITQDNGSHVGPPSDQPLQPGAFLSSAKLQWLVGVGGEA